MTRAQPAPGQHPLQKAGNALFAQYIHQLGLSPDTVGYWYLSASLDIARRDLHAMTCLTKYVYAAIAELYGGSPGAVESGLRRAVSACWSDNRALLEDIMGSPLKKKPSVGHFITRLSLWLENKP